MLQRHELAGDTRTDATVADLGVDGVGEVDRRRPDGQVDHITFGGEDVDLVLLQIGLQVHEELDGVRPLVLPVDDPVEPRQLLGAASRRFLVGEVRSDPRLGALVHLAGPDLHLDRLSLRSDDCCVQGLVQVELRGGDEVLEAPHNRRPDRVDRTKSGVAVLLGPDDHPHSDQIVDVVELLATKHHLLVDAPHVLGAPSHLRLDPHLREPCSELLLDLSEVDLTLGRPGRDHVVDLGVALRVQRGETQVLELLLEFAHAEPVSQGRVDVHRLPRRLLLLLSGERCDRPHVVQAIGELDDQDSNVVGHRDEHLADRCRLLRFLGVEMNPVKLGHTVDQRRDLWTEPLREVVKRQVGVLHGVVQERRHDGGLVQPEVGDDGRHRQRVGDVRLARAAGLALVRTLGDLISADNLVE